MPCAAVSFTEALRVAVVRHVQRLLLRQHLLERHFELLERALDGLRRHEEKRDFDAALVELEKVAVQTRQKGAFGRELGVRGGLRRAQAAAAVEEGFAEHRDHVRGEAAAQEEVEVDGDELAEHAVEDARHALELVVEVEQDREEDVLAGAGQTHTIDDGLISIRNFWRSTLRMMILPRNSR